MKIVNKIHVLNILAIVLIALTGFFAYQNLDLVLTKLRFAEIADDLNASFLEMRLAEKNYFLYADPAALLEIRKKLDESAQAMDSVKADIIRATGEKNFAQLKSSLEGYVQAIEQARISGYPDNELQASIREAGHRLREFSQQITQVERKRLNEIISHSRNELFSSLCFILVSSISISYLFFFNILKSLKRIENVAHAISEGDFGTVERAVPKDELGSVIRAINSMSQELQDREEQIIQSKKLASIGILTAGVAHELGNPLNNISMLAQAYQELFDTLDRDEKLDYMKRVDEECERIRQIVNNLLDFSKPKKADLKSADINSIVQRSLKLVLNMIHITNTEAHLHLQDGLPPVLVDEHQILEVLINLMTNSIQAASPGDQLTITTRLNETQEGVDIIVSDTGKGIPPEILPNIFDPFFSTKGTSGTGLGLFVSYGIIKNHGGRINVTSEVGVGTTFTVELPVYQGDKRSSHERL
jgi:two-component system NtrC family sensor kinase